MAHNFSPVKKREKNLSTFTTIHISSKSFYCYHLCKSPPLSQRWQDLMWVPAVGPEEEKSVKLGLNVGNCVLTLWVDPKHTTISLEKKSSVMQWFGFEVVTKWFSFSHWPVEFPQNQHIHGSALTITMYHCIKFDIWFITPMIMMSKKIEFLVTLNWPASPTSH